MISVTIFKSPRWWEAKLRYVYDNKTHRRIDFNSWPQFASFLNKLSQRPLAGKQSAELISPAIFLPNTTRANKNVTAWAGWAAIDVDDVEITGDLDDYLFDRYGNYNCVVYSTASSTRERPKYRAVFQTSRFVEPDNIRPFWFALQHEFNDAGDTQCKDFSRMYYIPATYDNAFNFFRSYSGAVVDVDDLLKRHPYVEKKRAGNLFDDLPDEWKQQILDHKKSSLSNANYSWSSYHDCPFWPKKLAIEYLTISQTGWYAKMYQIMIAIAGFAISKGYPISPNEIVQLCRQFDVENGNWYENRPMDIEAINAIEYALKNATVKE